MEKDVQKILEGITRELDSLTDSSGKKGRERFQDLEKGLASLEEFRQTLSSRDT